MIEPVSPDLYLQLFKNLALALALGFLIGLERGWSKRELEPGRRIAGVRTFGLISFLGALTMLLSREINFWVIALAFGGLGLLITIATAMESLKTGEYGITTEVAAFIAFVLGALAMTPYAILAAAAAVITTVVLGAKPVLHAWILKLKPQELHAVFKLLLISVVMLPILPDQSYDPWKAFNPYQIWWMVVLISAISFAGYFAVRIIGAGKGILLTGMFGGLASSTAVTLSLSRLAKTSQGGQQVFAAGVIAASSTMFPRILLVSGIFCPPLAERLFWPTLLAAGTGYATVWWLIRKRPGSHGYAQVKLENPFEFGTALRFGALLAIVIWLTKFLQQLIGEAGIYLTAAVSGITDVDAITLSLSRLAENPEMLQAATIGVIIAAVVNTFVKWGMTAAIAGGAMARYVGLGFGLTLFAGALGMAIGHWIIQG